VQTIACRPNHSPGYDGRYRFLSAVGRVMNKRSGYTKKSPAISRGHLPEYLSMPSFTFVVTLAGVAFAGFAYLKRNSIPLLVAAFFVGVTVLRFVIGQIGELMRFAWSSLFGA